MNSKKNKKVFGHYNINWFRTDRFQTKKNKIKIYRKCNTKKIEMREKKELE